MGSNVTKSDYRADIFSRND
ncbi:hypothetical protein BDFB_015219 [Asbolus verrucosus]|uniref:Uncharacterized protein n=1 Tax=Asbolus verrucosus TaxID=1661398 RepID=A0A482VJL6_ASBVE|nr:hypothetical protein BDFB_015219 [Asbolus verrucosus]